MHIGGILAIYTLNEQTSIAAGTRYIKDAIYKYN